MSNQNVTKYIVYDTWGVPKLRGSKYFIAYKLGYTPESVANSCRLKRKLKGKYRIEKISKPKEYIFTLSKDGKVEYEGTAKEIGKKLDINHRSVYKCYYDAYRIKGYTIDRK